MPATTPDGLRWPLPSDDPDVPRDIGLLATDTQIALDKKADKSTTPSVTSAGNRILVNTFVGTTNGSGALTVTYPAPFRSGTSPVVVAVPGDFPGVVGTNTTFVSANNPAGFTFNGMAANTQVRVNYVAYGLEA